ncbi:mismatch-specific DNA-glycosylase [Pseudoclavibacter sp. Z016]|uniref:mismatch-specific DNA-glycosylase n=1 Tax=Pseudoclavibacter sp. Z016 TaxID=2080581 RepID=UPI000CE8A1CF|nr:mismatch-specific DNA-glycosylase [Pseudoclavibacter sp. Z016]PPF76498.1 mismatch-specific DNA-glycosylase [Pseudoclavibacter sp. Z016]
MSSLSPPRAAGVEIDPSTSSSVPAKERRASPLGGRKPVTAELAQFQTPDEHAMDDILPVDLATVRLLIVGVNPGLWTAAVNAPFARPGNRFWPSLHRAGFTDHTVDASRGLSASDEQQLLGRGIALTNLVGRATARADELTPSELREGGRRVIERVHEMRPDAVAVAGITAFRTAFGLPKSKLGRQEAGTVPGWPEDVDLWVVPQPSGLNAHETIDTLAAKWREVWDSLPAE